MTGADGDNAALDLLPWQNNFDLSFLEKVGFIGEREALDCFAAPWFYLDPVLDLVALLTGAGPLDLRDQCAEGRDIPLDRVRIL